MRGFWTGAKASGTAGGRQTSRDPGSPWGEIEQVREGETEGGETGLDTVLDIRYSESMLTDISLSVSDYLPLNWDFSPRLLPIRPGQCYQYMDGGWVGKEGRDMKKGMFFPSQVEGNSWEQRDGKQCVPTLRARSQLKSGGNDHREDREEQVKQGREGAVREGRKSSSHPRSLLSR